ncbi:MAG: ligand-binding sensor domain-containing protein [Patiriisocius sp.]|uniref:ligand-binding sensor domain-containing protein n=1 Tax=Patiriisocius sp. TaxID=2822396 RepID=UPI003EF18A59
MNKLPILISILLIALSGSCIEKNVSVAKTNIPEILKKTESDTLNFTSGIRVIFQDSKGKYWLGSHNEGVCVYNGKTFQYFTTNEGLANNQVRNVQEDTNGNIWLGTASGVSMYDGEHFSSATNDTHGPTIGWKNTEESLWFNAGDNKGVYQFDGFRVNYMAFPLPKKNAHRSFGVTGISEGKEGSIWIATYSGLFHFDGESITMYDEKKLKRNETERLHIRSVLADSKGNIWIGNNGIGVLLMQGDKTINFSNKMGLIHFESILNGSRSPNQTLEHVFAIEEDGNGDIWFGDRDAGAWKFDGKNMTHYTVDEDLSSPMIWDIYKDNNNNLFFGMESGGVYTFNGTSFEKAFN